MWLAVLRSNCTGLLFCSIGLYLLVDFFAMSAELLQDLAKLILSRTKVCMSRRAQAVLKNFWFVWSKISTANIGGYASIACYRLICH